MTDKKEEIRIKIKTDKDLVLFESICIKNTIRKTLEKAIVSYADLRNANLGHTDLSNTDLSNTDLSNANLSHVYLRNADLSHAGLSRANLSRANLSNVNLGYANLSHADLSNADLSNADLSRANFYNADLSDIKISTNDHCLLSEILFRKAKTTNERMWAGIVRISTDWCWGDFEENMTEEAKAWTIEIFSKYPELSGKLKQREKYL